MQLLCGGRHLWEQILHYIYTIFMCKDDEHNLDFSCCFNWEGLRLVYDMYFRHFNVLLKILLHVQWFFPRSIVFPPNNRSNGNGRCEHVFPMKQKDCMSMAMFVYQRASIDYRYYPKASQRMQQQITTNAHRFLDKS